MLKMILTPLFVGLLLLALSSNVSAQGAKFHSNSNHADFIENKGQIKDQDGKRNQAVKFLLPGSNGMNIQLLSNGFSYDTYFSHNVRSSHSTRALLQNKAEKFSQHPDTLEFHRIDVVFEGANPSPEIVAEQRRPTRYQYTRGTSAGPENTIAYAYARVIYRNLYSNIDLIFDGATDNSASGAPEYYFVVKPGGNASVICWKYKGALKTAIEQQQIHIGINHGSLREKIPSSWQSGGGDPLRPAQNKAQHVTVNYRNEGTDKFKFSIPRYDHSKSLIIDPTPDLIWGTYYGGSDVDWGYCIAKDGDGNAIFGGDAGSASNIATAGAHKVVFEGIDDCMLGKFSPAGDLLWATYYGGSAYEDLWGIACDNNNNIVATGISFSNDGIATPGAYKTTRTAFAGCANAFIAKFSPDGLLTWATYFGGEYLEICRAVAIDHSDNIIITGGTCSMTDIASPGAYKTSYSGGSAAQQLGKEDIFIAKFSSQGARLWSTYYGGDDFERANAIAVDPDDNIVITGNSYSPNLSTPGTFQPDIDVANAQSGIVSKFSSSGSLIWSSYFGKGGIPRGGGVGLGVAVDKRGGIYVGGYTCCDKNIGTPGAMQPLIGAANEYGDGFLIKFDKTGNRVWGTYVGGTATDAVNAVTTDGDDAVWITGSLQSQNIAVTAGSYQPTLSGTEDPFITKFNASGVLQYGTYYGQTSQPGWYSGEGMGIAYAGNGNVFVVGHTSVDKGIATCNAVQKNHAGNGDAFIAKFGEKSQPIVPSVSISTDHAGTICPETTVVFTADGQGTGNMASYSWTVNGQPQPGSSSTITLNNLVEGDQVECTLDVNSACTTGQFKSNIITVHLDPALPPSVVINTQSTTVCPGASTSFTAQGTNEGSAPSYQWQVDGINVGENSSTFVTSILNSGSVVSCILTHHGSCIKDSVANSNPIAISLVPVPDVKASISASSETVCSGALVEFTAIASGSSNISYQWLLNGQPVGAKQNQFSSKNLENGDQIVCLANANDGVCSFPSVNSNTIVETVNPVPEITIIGEHSIARGQSVQLNASVSPAPAQFTWTPDSTLNNATTLSPVATPKQTTTYDLKVFSDKGCEAEKTFEIEVIPRIVIPNAFTPNSDGKNDVFRAIYGSDIFHVHLAIFDRWGLLVFEDNGSHKTWDGSYDGKPLSAGTYAWIFQYIDAVGAARVLKGTVLLIR